MEEKLFCYSCGSENVREGLIIVPWPIGDGRKKICIAYDQMNCQECGDGHTTSEQGAKLQRKLHELDKSYMNASVEAMR